MTMSQGFGAHKMEAAVEALTSNGSQREPSMEEILASIRRIIEDNDAPAARAADTAGAAANGASGSVSGEERAQERMAQPVEAQQPAAPQVAAVEERAAPFQPAPDVESFRAGLREEPFRPSVSEKRDEGRAANGFATQPVEPEPAVDHGLMQRLAEARPAAAPVVEDVADVDDASDVYSYRSVEEQEPEAARPEDAGAEELPQVQASADEGEGAKQGILSEYTGRKVAAAFGELNEAFEASRRRQLDQMAEEMLRPMLQDWLDNNLPTIVERLVREEIERIARGG